MGGIDCGVVESVLFGGAEDGEVVSWESARGWGGGRKEGVGYIAEVEDVVCESDKGGGEGAYGEEAAIEGVVEADGHYAGGWLVGWVGLW